MPEAKRKMRANEIEAEIMRRIADHPDCGKVRSVSVHAATNAEPPNPTWELGTVDYHERGQDAATAHVRKVVSDLQREIDLST